MRPVTIGLVPVIGPVPTGPDQSWLVVSSLTYITIYSH